MDFSNININATNSTIQITKTDTAMEELEWHNHAYKTGDQYVTRCGKIAIFMTVNTEKNELTWVKNSDKKNDDVVVFKTDFDCHEINGDTRLDIVGEYYIVPIEEYVNRRV